MSDIKAIGLDTVQGMLHTEAFYWDLNDESRAFTKRFIEKRKVPPAQAQAGSYSAVLNYLRAIDKTKTDDAGKVIAQIKSTPFKDAFTPHGYVRTDGRMVHDMYLVRSRKPSEPRGEWISRRGQGHPRRSGVPPDGQGRLPAGFQALSTPCFGVLT